MLRPVAVLWSLLLAALLALLPCAASARTLSGAPASGPEAHGVSARPVAKPAEGPSARAATAGERADAAQHPAAQHPAAASDAPGAGFILCVAEGPGQVPGHGCSSHPFCGPESHLPNAPPQPGTAVRPLLVAPPAPAAAAACGTPTGSHHAPDLHVLQVHRS
ncbi:MULTISPECIES: hypothetical protein [Kitasatospora]|uniref:Uncharacterized protein n=1 Tax=Kitasatospora setae (strain ATCC 33774 / DSM 43861 / JCM 3304 / KCC A-0304 / NBRC 14216 / KM-6054) TaxID=452652 RepID=E4N9B3_KITSK|nr:MULTISPECIES: hypothetical protein [Kitasatospora]BAJ27794.1 hypothetical protein KSE_19700 [Kitasatospora setae KM-6054]